MNLDEKIHLLFGNLVEPKAVKMFIKEVLEQVKPELVDQLAEREKGGQDAEERMCRFHRAGGRNFAINQMEARIKDLGL